MKRYCIIILIVSLTFKSCITKFSDKTNLALFLTKAFYGDNVAPFVNFTSPSLIDTEFEINKQVVVVFSEPVRPNVPAPILLSSSGNEVQGKWTISNSSLLFTPSTDLPIKTEFSVLIYGVEDSASNKMSDLFQYKFKTGTERDTTPIKIKATYPEQNTTNFSLNKILQVEFSEALHPDSTVKDNFLLKEEDAGVNIDYSIVNRGNILHIAPAGNLKKSTRYSLTIKSSVKDTANLALGSDFKLIFLTGTDTDNTLPSVQNTFPEPTSAIGTSIKSDDTKSPRQAIIEKNANQDIYPRQFINVDFSEPVNQLVISNIANSDLFVSDKSDGRQINVVAFSSIASLALYNRNALWEEDKNYVLVIRQTISDTSNNRAANEFRLNFKTLRTTSLATPPDIASISPSNTSTNVALNSKIKVVFTKPIFRASITQDSLFIKDATGTVVSGTFSYENNTTVVFSPDEILKPNTTYTGTITIGVKGLNNDKISSGATFSFITENMTAPKSIIYGSNFYPLNRNVSTPPISPSYNGYITSCTVTPALPAGLFLLTSNCTIYGTPVQLSESTIYTITGSNLAGASSTRISLAVTEIGANPLYVGYSSPEYKLVKDSPITSIVPSSSGFISSCSADPSLPAGLSLSSNCTISGTPTEYKASSDYTITASNGSKTTKGNLRLSVNSSGTLIGSITINASVAYTTVWEGVGNLVVTVSLSASPASLIAVDYTTQNGTAVAGSDYTAVSGTLYFRSGETSKTINIPINNDGATEPNETFVFKMTQALGDSSNFGAQQLNLILSDSP